MTRPDCRVGKSGALVSLDQLVLLNQDHFAQVCSEERVYSQGSQARRRENKEQGAQGIYGIKNKAAGHG